MPVDRYIAREIFWLIFMGSASSTSLRSSAGCHYSAGTYGWRLPALQRINATVGAGVAFFQLPGFHRSPITVSNTSPTKLPSAEFFFYAAQLTVPVQMNIAKATRSGGLIPSVLDR